MDRRRRKTEVVPRRQEPVPVNRRTKFPDGAQLVVGSISIVPSPPVLLERRDGRWWVVASNTGGKTWIDLDALRDFCVSRDLWNECATRPGRERPTREEIATRLRSVARGLREDAGCDDPEVPDNPEVLLVVGELAVIAAAVQVGASMTTAIERLGVVSAALRDRAREQKPKAVTKTITARTPFLDETEDMMREIE